MKNEGCPICGYTEITVLDEHGCTTFEICDSCGCESGYQYMQNSPKERIEELRRDWVINKKCKWHSTVTKEPVNWSPIEQMEKAGISASK